MTSTVDSAMAFSPTPMPSAFPTIMSETASAMMSMLTTMTSALLSTVTESSLVDDSALTIAFLNGTSLPPVRAGPPVANRTADLLAFALHCLFLAVALALNGWIWYVMRRLTLVATDQFNVQAFLADTLLGLLTLGLHLAIRIRLAMAAAVEGATLSSIAAAVGVVRLCMCVSLLIDAILACCLPMFHAIVRTGQILSMRTTSIIGRRGVGGLIAAAWVFSLGLSVVGVLKAFFEGGSLARSLKREVFIYKISCLCGSLVATSACNVIVYCFVKKRQMMVSNAVGVMINVVKSSTITMAFIWLFEVRKRRDGAGRSFYANLHLWT